jgi:hypothetical protein
MRIASLACRCWLAAVFMGFAQICASAMVNVQETHELEYFAPSEPLARGSVKLISIPPDDGGADTGAFHAVWVLDGAATGDLARGICLRAAARERLLPGWLAREVARLSDDLPARTEQVRFTLRTSVLDVKTGRVLDWREFAAAFPAPRADTYGVIAANRAVRAVLEEISAFCTK